MTKKVTAEAIAEPQESVPWGKDLDIAMIGEPSLAKDIVGITPGIWPGNTAHRLGSYYLDLRKLDLEQGQLGKFSALPEFWVFERVDIHGLEPPDTDLELSVILDNCESVGNFRIPKGKNSCLCTHRQDAVIGRFLGGEDIFIRLLSEPPKEGRIVINFCGYLIEPWR